MFATAFRTPFPRYRLLSPSRSSSASRSPVDAPDGTAARPVEPPSSVTSTSTVGLPRESRISRPCTLVIFTSGSSAAAVGLCFVAQGFLAERRDERFIVGGDDHDTVVGDGVAPTIFFEVVA